MTNADTQTPDTRCGIHGHPTSPIHRCSACDDSLPYWHELLALDSISDGWNADLRIDTGDFRVWTARTGTEDGEPYEHTVYVEASDPTSGWLDLGHYDGTEPPRGLPGVTRYAFAGELVQDCDCNPTWRCRYHLLP